MKKKSIVIFSTILATSLLSSETVTITIPKPPAVPEVIKVKTIGGYEDKNKIDNKIQKKIEEKKVQHTPTEYLNKIKKKENIRKEPEKKKTIEKKQVIIRPPVVKTTTHKTVQKPIKKQQEQPKKEVKKEIKKPKVIVGDTKFNRVPAYLYAKIEDEKKIKESLKKYGFKILSTSDLDGNGKLKVIVFTNQKLEDFAKNRKDNFFTNLRILIDKEHNRVAVTNPLYFGRAFMTDKYDDKLVHELLKEVNNLFDTLTTSSDKLKYTLLPRYNFMFGMPKYDDFIDIAEDDDEKSENLINKIKDKKEIAFIQKISHDKYIVGLNFPQSLSAFIHKIGTQNSELLPYPVLIENGVAKILDPKYYLAISYPMLKMSQFMSIASIPSQIEDKCKKIFK